MDLTPPERSAEQEELRVLISAYACEPERGSEPEVGLRTVIAVATDHRTWVLTRANNIPGLERFFEGRPERGRLTFVPVELSPPMRRIKRLLGPLGMHLFYDRWQRKAGDIAVALDALIDFHLVHHVTFANYWTALGVSDVNKPLVWGPVGGGTQTPWRLMSVMGMLGPLQDVARRLAQAIVGAVYARQRTKPAQTLAQNLETAKRLPDSVPTRVFPNAVCAEVGPISPGEQPSNVVVVVGRLERIKAPILALRAFERLNDQTLRLVYVGDGPVARGLQRSVNRSRIGPHVELLGAKPRQQTLELISQSRLLLHTCLHEEAGMAVVEALRLGKPVVALKMGGPRALSELWPDAPLLLVDPSTPRVTVSRLSDAMRSALDSTTSGLDPIPIDAYARMLEATYRAAIR